MRAWLRRFRSCALAPSLVVVLLVGACDHLQIGEPVQQPREGRSQPGTGGPFPTEQPPPAGRVYPTPEVARPGGPPPPTPESVRVALLLPLSGPQAGLAQGMLNAAELAVFDLADQNFQLLPYDTRGASDGAADAARMAADDGVQLMLGPLLATSVRAVSPVAEAARVPVIAFSSDRTVAGSGIYILGFTPEAEVRRVVRYAYDNGLKRFAALAPRDAYGDAVVAALRDTAASLGTPVDRVEYFEPTVRDFGAVVQRLTRRGAKASGPETPGPVTGAEAGEPVSQLPFDALLIAAGGERLRAIGAHLPVYGIDPEHVRILGTGAWDEPDVGSEPALVGAWFAAPSPSYRAAFETQYTQAFGEAPPRLATLAYDATALAAVLGRGSGADRFSERAIADPSGFRGRDGIFRFQADGVAERGLAVLQVEPRGTSVISEPPLAFGGS